MILLFMRICLKKTTKLERDQICGYRAGVRNPMEKHNPKGTNSQLQDKYSGCYVQHEKMDYYKLTVNHFTTYFK